MNDTELMPALSTAFSDAKASSASDLETIFDDRVRQEASNKEAAGPGRPNNNSKVQEVCLTHILTFQLAK